MAQGDIEDLYCDLSDDNWVEGAIDFEEVTIIENDDITILKNQEALWQCIVGVLKTPTGYVDGTTLEGYGSELLRLRGQNLNYHLRELAKVYINNTIPQFEGRVYSFPQIEISQPKDFPRSRFTMIIRMTVDSIYGSFNRTLYI